MKFFFLILVFHQSFCWFYGKDAPDRWTQGGVFPLPQEIGYYELNRTVHPTKTGFDFGEKKDCDVLRTNAEIYLNKWMFPYPVEPNGTAEDFVIVVRVKEDCPSTPPTQESSEAYKLRVSVSKATISADTVWGAVRAIDTLSQLIFFDEAKQQYLTRTVEISDYPRFSIRGIMIDTARHFLSVKTIKRQLDIMAMNKMNVLHWHLVDSESFPYESKAFPNLHTMGAYSPRHVYTRRDVADIIDYARLRGIRVMPEFDLPGHTGAWKGEKGFLADCFDPKGQPAMQNLMDVTEQKNFDFLEKFLEESVNTFPEEFHHMGGDEVHSYIKACWERNPKVRKFMAAKGFGKCKIALENYFFEKLYEIMGRLSIKKKLVFWQEVFDNNKPENESIIHIWKGDTHEAIYEKAQKVTAAGHKVILSACWYLNYHKYGRDWRDLSAKDVPSNSRYYYCDPTGFEGTPEQKALVLGGIAAMWGEMVDNTNIEARLWPRASAVAERLWSPMEKTKNADDAWPRLHEMRCRLVARGYRLEPVNDPDFCPFELEN